MKQRGGSRLTPVQRSTFLACFLGWSLDAFDFFLLTLCLRPVAAEFYVPLPVAANAIFWTLAMRPVGALLFGYLADRYGRRPTLMINVVSFSAFELLSAFAPTFSMFLACRALFGIAMGGEWGVGAALALEVLPPERRGFFSGLLQEGYVVGNLLAAALFGLVFSHLPTTGSMTPWRWLFVVGALPALLAVYLRSKVEESPAWLNSRAQRIGRGSTFGGEGRAAGVRRQILQYLPTFLYLALLMTAFNSFSHGTQDLYPSFLGKDYRLGSGAIGTLTVVGNVGALLGGILFGSLSERWGRRRMIVVAALLALPVIPLWSHAPSLLLLGAGGFLMQFMVQGAWGVIPAHLNELSPGPVRATLPGFAYQLGNLISSKNGVLQAAIAEQRFQGSLRPVLAGTVALVAVMVAGLTMLGREQKGVSLTADERLDAHGVS